VHWFGHCRSVARPGPSCVRMSSRVSSSQRLRRLAAHLESAPASASPSAHVVDNVKRGSGAWVAADARSGAFEWCHRLSETELSELDARVQALVANDRWKGVFSRPQAEWRDAAAAAAPPAPALAARMAAVARDLAEGHGFALIKGLPVER
jgi:hypothetical protein